MTTPYYDRMNILSIAHACEAVIANAPPNSKAFRLAGNLLELVASILVDVPLETLKTALVVAGIDFNLPTLRSAHSAMIDAIQTGQQDSAYYLAKQVYRLVVR